MPPLKKPASGGSVPPAPPPYLSSSDTFAYPVPALDGGNPNDPEQAISVAFLPAETVPAGREGEWIPPGPPPQPAYVPEASASYQYAPAPASSPDPASPPPPPYLSSSDRYGSYIPALDGGNPSDPDQWVSTAFLPPETVPTGRENEWLPPGTPPGGAGYLGVSLTPAQTNTPPPHTFSSGVSPDVRWAPPPRAEAEPASLPASIAPSTAAPTGSPPPALGAATNSGYGAADPYQPHGGVGNGYGGFGSPAASYPTGTAYPGSGVPGGNDDPFAAMQSNPLFARYFAVLERRYGREGAMRRMRGLSRRLRFGHRTRNGKGGPPIHPDAPAGVPTNAEIRRDLSDRLRPEGRDKAQP